MAEGQFVCGEFLKTKDGGQGQDVSTGQLGSNLANQNQENRDSGFNNLSGQKRRSTPAEESAAGFHINFENITPGPESNTTTTDTRERERQRSASINNYTPSSSSSSRSQSTFLDRLRTQSNPFRRSSKSVISTPTEDKSPTHHFQDFIYGSSYNGSDNIDCGLTKGHNTPSSGGGTKPRKWFSFSSLNNRINLTNLLNIPKSRLSVSSTLSSVFNGSGAPSPVGDSDSVSHFINDDPDPIKIYESSFYRGELGSPTPSCQTVSGEFPSRFSNYNNYNYCPSGQLSYSPSITNTNNNPAVVLRRRKSSGRCVSGSSYGGGSGGRNSDRISLPSSNCSANSNTRLSCGEFYPGPAGTTPTSCGFSEFQFSGNWQNSNSIQSYSNFEAKKSLGRSLPTLLEAMEGRGNSVDPNMLRVPVEAVIDLLYQEFAVLTGSKTYDDHYIILFPDRGNFQYLAEEDYRKLMIYLISVPPIQDSETGFVIIIDRRQDKWHSVKNTLVRISNFFPGLIHRVFVLRPVGFLQKALSEVSTKLFRTENLRFRLTVCNHVNDLSSFISQDQLTCDLGGKMIYNKVCWVQQRIEVEGFSHALQMLSKELKAFTESFNEIECPNDVITTEHLIIGKSEEYQRLNLDLSQAFCHGESLVTKIKDDKVDKTSIQIINVISVERFILQIEETNKLFQEFWIKEKSKLEQCLHLRRFEQDFRELQASFDLNIKTLSSLLDKGENLEKTDALIAETLNFQQSALEDVKKAIDLENLGREIAVSNPSSKDSVEPKCVELSRMGSHFRFSLEEKIGRQYLWRRVQSTIERGMELIAAHKSENELEDPSDSLLSLEKTDEYLDRLQSQIDELIQLKNSLNNISVSQLRTLVKQILKRAEEIQDMVAKRRSFFALQNSKLRSRISPNSIILNFGSTQQSNKYNTSSSSSVDGKNSSSNKENDKNIKGSVSNSNGQKVDEETAESRRIKRGHVLNELLSTEKLYVEEMGEILTGYRDQISNSDLKLPSQSQMNSTNSNSNSNNKGKKNQRGDVSPIVSILFCNLDEIYSFHSKIFSPDLSNCIQSLELVGLCFIQRNSDFLAMYSKYCQLLPASEALRREIGENHPIFVSCRNNIKHKLPLGAYLLKPVQRITKYQLLLKDLVKYSEGCEGRLELIEALDCMLVVLRYVNDGMHQLSISGYPTPLHEEGPLLLQGSFTLWTETAKDKLRINGHLRQVFLYKQSILICKKCAKSSSYEFRTKLNLSEVGLTESLKGSGSTKKFEIWVQGRQKIFLLQAETQDMKDLWVRELKRLLMEQLESLRITKASTAPASMRGLTEPNNSAVLKRNKLKGNTLNGWRSQSHRPLRQTSSWDAPDSRFIRSKSRSSSEKSEIEEETWSSDELNSDDEDLGGVQSSKTKTNNNSSSIVSESSSIYGNGEVLENGPMKYIALADYNSISEQEVNLKEGEVVNLLKMGLAGWSFVSKCDSIEGWVPFSFLEQFGNGNKHSSTVSSLCSSSSGGGTGFVSENPSKSQSSEDLITTPFR